MTQLRWQALNLDSVQPSSPLLHCSDLDLRRARCHLPVESRDGRRITCEFNLALLQRRPQRGQQWGAQMLCRGLQPALSHPSVDPGNADCSPDGSSRPFARQALHCVHLQTWVIGFGKRLRHFLPAICPSSIPQLWPGWNCPLQGANFRAQLRSNSIRRVGGIHK